MPPGGPGARLRCENPIRGPVMSLHRSFARMTPAWRRLGFPFARLVPSLSSAIGSSSDRPYALAELMGTIVSDGLRLPTIEMRELRFAADTPYETVFRDVPNLGRRVMPAAVARLLRPMLAGVVQVGTGRRAAGVFGVGAGMVAELGGKTGSGDNRYKTFIRGGGVTSSIPVSRTAAFVFYIGDRYFGVITASVTGKEAGGFHFTSTLTGITIPRSGARRPWRPVTAPPPAPGSYGDGWLPCARDPLGRRGSGP